MIDKIISWYPELNILEQLVIFFGGIILIGLIWFFIYIGFERIYQLFKRNENDENWSVEYLERMRR